MDTSTQRYESEATGWERGLYRCLVQWPAFLETVWGDLEPVRESGRFDPVSAGFEDDVVDDLADLFAGFNSAIADTVLPVVPVYASTVDAEGRRSF